MGGKPHPHHRQTVVSLSPSTTELVATYAPLYEMVGRTAACNYPVVVASIPVITLGAKIDEAKIKAANPGVIIYDDALFRADEIEKLKAPGNEIFVLKGDTIDQFIDTLYEMGKTFHGELAFSGYIDSIRSARSTALADPLPPGTKVAVVLPDSHGIGMAAGKGSFLADVVKATGATLVGPEGTRFGVVNPENLIGMNPDDIVIAATKETGPAAVQAILSDPRYKSITAVKTRHIIVLDQDVVLRRGQRVDVLIDSMHRQLKAQN